MSANLKAGAIMVLSVTLLTLNDGIAKYLSADLSVPQLLFYRGLVATVVLAVAAKVSGYALRHRALTDRWVLARAGLDVSCTFTFLVGLTLLPIAIATTLVFVSPIVLTILAAVFLREHVGWRRWTAVLAGFAGVVLITGLGGQAWTYAVLFPLASAILIAVRDLVTRMVSPAIPTIYVALATSVFVTLAGLLGLPFAENPLELRHIGWLMLMALLICGSYFGYITAIRLGELSFVAPMVYASILVALGLGVLIWNDAVSWRQLAGITMIVTSGVVIFVRENARRREALRA